MRNTTRLAQIAHEAGVIRTEKLPPLTPYIARPQLASPDDVAEARRILVQQRTSDNSYKDPLKQKRRIFRSKEKNETLANPEKWTFSLAERSAALDGHIRALGAIGVARAILEHNNDNEPFDVGLLYVEDSKGKKNSEIVTRPNDWLEHVTENNSLDYVTLLASRSSRQPAKDRALSIALNRKFTTITKELLRYGANPNGQLNDYFLPAIKQGDTELVRLFLSAPNALDQSATDRGLVAAVERNQSGLVPLLIAHGADAKCENGAALAFAVRSQSIRDLAEILSNGQHTIPSRTFSRAVELACSIDSERRDLLLEAMLCAGADANHPALQSLLFQAVQGGQLRLVALLISCGTSPDQNEAECVHWAIASLSISMLETLLRGDISKLNASKALLNIPDEASELEFRSITILLITKEVTEEALGECLVRVVAKHFHSLVAILVRRCASLHFQDAACIRLVLRDRNIPLLKMLLEGSCSPSYLGKVLPEAMAIRPSSIRFEAMKLLLEKGASGQGLHKALQSVVSDNCDSNDYSLLHLLIRHKASPDFCDENGNSIRIAVERGDLKAVELLCQASPSPETVSPALPIAMIRVDSEDHSKTYQVLSALLRHGAYGNPLAETLITAIQQRRSGRIVGLLLEHGADVNYRNGRAIEYALSAPDSDHLRLICGHGRIDREPLERLLPEALDPRKFDPEKVCLLVKYSEKYRSILDRLLLSEVESPKRRREVIDLLLQSGASVNFQHAGALQRVVQTEDIEIIRVLVAARPAKSHLSRAFLTAASNRSSPKRYDLMREILQHGDAEIGQDETLVQEAASTDNDVLRYVKLLLDHGAAVDFQGGAAIQESIRAKNLSLFNFFMTLRPKLVSLENAFLVARKVPLSNDMRLHVFESILGSGVGNNQASEALVEAVERDPSDMETARLLTQYGASVEHDGGLALQRTATAVSLPVLDLFLSQQPSAACLTNAFHHTRLTHLSLSEKFQVYRRLLPGGIATEEVSKALIEAISVDPMSLQLPDLLVKNGASVDFDGAQCIRLAVDAGNVSLLQLLLEGTPRPSSLEAGFSRAMKAELLSEQRMDMYRLFLQKGIRPDSVSRALVHHILAGTFDQDLLLLLLNNNASLDFDSGKAICAVSEKGDVPTLQVLLRGKKPEMTTFSKAFLACIALDRTKRLQIAELILVASSSISSKWLSQHLLRVVQTMDHDLLSLVLKHGAEASHDDGESLIFSAVQANPVTTKMLIIPRLSESVVSKAFEEMLGAGAMLHTGGAKTAEILLERGVRKGLIDRALEQAFSYSGFIPNNLVKLFLAYGANGNALEGVYFARAASIEDMELFKILLRHQPEPSVVIPALIQSVAPEKVLLRFLKSLIDEIPASCKSLHASVLFLAMERFPRGEGLVRLLLGSGCSSSAMKETVINPAFGPENVTVLVWALLREQPRVSDSVIIALIEATSQAEVQFVSSKTRISPALLATKSSRPAVLEALMNFDVDVSHRDHENRSSLFYASGKGDLESVKLLIRAGARHDDASLHEAARNAHPRVVSYVLSNGHHAHFPSSLHSDGSLGRTPLEELCLKSGPDANSTWHTSIRQTIELLLPSNGKHLEKSNGKSILHLALDNKNALDITEALLEFPQIWEHINDPIHQYEDPDGLVYSPTKYVEHLRRGPKSESQALIKLLHGKRCQDRYYSRVGNQPANPFGVPDDISAEIARQRRIQQEQEQEMKRAEALAAHQQDLEMQSHQRSLKMSEERHKQSMHHARDRAAFDLRLTQDKHALALTQQGEMDQKRRDGVRQDNQLRLEFLDQEAFRRQAIQEAEQGRELNHKSKMIMQDQKAEEASIERQKKLMWDRDHAAEKQHNRQLRLIERQDESVKTRAREMERVADTARGINTRQMLQLEDDIGLD